MESLITYIVRSVLLSGLLTGYYLLALRGRRMHVFNRFYLLASVVLALVLPLVRIWSSIRHDVHAAASNECRGVLWIFLRRHVDRLWKSLRVVVSSHRGSAKVQHSWGRLQ